jgi:hypothetical protein
LITLPFPLAFQAHGSAGLEFHGFAPDFFQRPKRHISLQRHSRGFVLDKNSIFGSLTLQDFSHKVKIGEEGIRGFEGKRVYDLTRDYIIRDVDILYRSLLEIENQPGGPPLTTQITPTHSLLDLPSNLK